MESISKSMIDTSVGKILRDYRIKKGLTQEKIAELLGISVKYVSRIENGTGGIKLETLVKYINLLGIIPNVLFQDLILDQTIQSQLKLSDKISDLSEEKIEFLFSLIDLLKHLN